MPLLNEVSAKGSEPQMTIVFGSKFNPRSGLKPSQDKIKSLTNNKCEDLIDFGDQLPKANKPTISNVDLLQGLMDLGIEENEKTISRKVTPAAGFDPKKALIDIDSLLDEPLVTGESLERPADDRMDQVQARPESHALAPRVDLEKKPLGRFQIPVFLSQITAWETNDYIFFSHQPWEPGQKPAFVRKLPRNQDHALDSYWPWQNAKVVSHMGLSFAIVAKSNISWG